MNASGSNSFNLTATEDLGGGLRATAVIQNRFDAENKGFEGANKGDMFVDLAGGFGSVRVGSFTTISYAGMNAFASNTTSALSGVYATTGASGKNTIQYTTPNINGFQARLFQTRTGVASAAANNGLALHYNQGPLAVMLVSSTAKGVGTVANVHSIAGTAATGDAAKANSDIAGQAIGASYKLDMATVYATYYSAKVGTAAENDSGWHISAAMPMGAITLKAGYRASTKSAAFGMTAVTTDAAGGALNTAATAVGARNFNQTSLGLDYAFSKRTVLTAETVTRSQAKGDANAIGSRGNASYIGLTHAF